jgi:hypothetical protein
VFKKKNGPTFFHGFPPFIGKSTFPCSFGLFTFGFIIVHQITELKIFFGHFFSVDGQDDDLLKSF